MSDHDNFDPTLGDDPTEYTEPTFDQLVGDDVYSADDMPPVEDTVVVTSWSAQHDAPIEEEVSRAEYEASHPEPATTEPQIEVIGQRRVFVVGGTRIPDSDSTMQMTNEQVRESLKASFPEVANATIREREESGVSYVEFLAQPGKKG